MGRTPRNDAEKTQNFRISKDLRDAFNLHAKRTGESAASRIRTLMYQDLPEDLRKNVQEPHRVNYVEKKET